MLKPKAGLWRRLGRAWSGQAAPPNAFLGDHTALTLLDGLMMFVDTRGIDVTPSLLMRGVWEPEATALFQRLIRPGDTVLDLGAHLGVYALLAARGVGPGGQVHAFEPNARYADLATRSLSVNGFAGHARVHELALGEAEGQAELVFSWAWGGGGHVAIDRAEAKPEQERQPCRVIALDEMFSDPEFRVDVVKMDIEGAEGRALRGMWRLLERSPNARVMFEFAPGLIAMHGVGAAEMIHLLSELGFRFWEIGAQSQLRALEAEALADSTDSLRNILAARGAALPAKGP